MSDGKIVEVIYGKHSKFEIVKQTGIISNSQYYVRKDGKPFKGAYSSLSDAVEAAKKEG